MFRRYNITIDVKKGIAGKNNVLKVFGCSVSEPSNWAPYGSTRQRGLTFLDKSGKELDSPIFQHRYSLNPSRSGSEINEIIELIREALAQHFHINPADAVINVSEYNRL